MVRKVVRKPVEKLSENENVMIIDSSSEEEDSSDEEIFIPEIAPPKQNVIAKPSNKVPCDICGKEFSKGGIRMHRISCEKKQGSVAPPVPIQKKQVAPDIDDDDKPMTARQMKAFLAAQNAPVVKKPRKPYTRKPKVEPAPPTTPAPTPPTPRNNIPQMKWA
mgnify:CR=1 FL=1